MKGLAIHSIRQIIILLASLFVISCSKPVQLRTPDGKPARLEIRRAGDNSVRITFKPIDFEPDFQVSVAIAQKDFEKPVIGLQEISEPVNARVGNLSVTVKAGPLTITVENREGKKIQELTLLENGNWSFLLDESPVLGMGEGGRSRENWRDQDVQFDRRGTYDSMRPRWYAGAYGSRNPVPLLVGTGGWAVLVVPWVEVDLRKSLTGEFAAWKPPLAMDTSTHNKNALQGRPPVDDYVPGLWDFLVFDATKPTEFLKDISVLIGSAVMPPKWALGYMQSHRTLTDDRQMISIVDTFRKKRIPIDAVIYLGTGFCPRGWNTKQPSLEFNPEVFKREPNTILLELRKRNVKTVVHVVPWRRNRLPTLQGTIPPRPDEVVDKGHILPYWAEHTKLVEAGVDAFWPDEGDWFNLTERVKRHQLYYQGPLSSRPNIRPWSLHRNGHLGIAQWGGWVWSGDTESSWKTLEAQIAVGLNHSLSLSPYWGSDIGGFYPNPELTGELYARWFQFASFTPSFRSHGKTWWMRLPWGWGLDEMGPLEHKDNPLPSSLHHSEIEPICKKYAELRYQLMPYTYTLARQATESGLPLMRALWIHYPGDKNVFQIGDEYLWGEELLIAPVFEKNATSRTLYLPEGTWFDFWTNERISGMKTITRSVDLATLPIYVRAGAIIPFDPLKQYTSELINEPVTIKIYTGKDGKFDWYEDDGISLEYLEGKFQLTNLTWNDSARSLTIKPQSSFNTPPRTLVVELVNENLKKTVHYNNAKTIVTF